MNHACVYSQLMAREGSKAHANAAPKAPAPGFQPVPAAPEPQPAADQQAHPPSDKVSSQQTPEGSNPSDSSGSEVTVSKVQHRANQGPACVPEGVHP